jgi:site-specific recombinase XerD
VALDEDCVSAARAQGPTGHRTAGLGHGLGRHRLVFTHEDGSSLHPEFITRHFERLARAGLTPIRLHDLRHGAATLALGGGADLKTVSEMCVHDHDHRGHLRQRAA